MRKYIIKRILISIVILFFVAFVIYALMRCLPTSYVEAMARQKSMQPGSKSFEEWMEQLTRMYNLDVGIIPGFFKWLGQMLTFKFGDSWLWTKPVTEVFNDSVDLFLYGPHRIRPADHHRDPPGRGCRHQAVQQDGLCHLCAGAGRYFPAYLLLCFPAVAGVLRETGLV